MRARGGHLTGALGLAERLRRAFLTKAAPLVGRRYTKGVGDTARDFSIAELSRLQEASNRAHEAAIAHQGPRFVVNHAPFTPEVADINNVLLQLADACRDHDPGAASATSTWSHETVRQAERQSSANGRLMGYATRIWREQGYDDDVVLRLRRGLLAGIPSAQRELDAEHADPGTQSPRPVGGPTARGVAFGVYGSQTSGDARQEAGA
jgi:hypothetical protein